MNFDTEVKKFEKLFSNDGSLRSQIDKLVKNKVFYDRLKNLEEDWTIFKDVLLSIGFIIGDVLTIHHLIKSTPRSEVEVKALKEKNQRGNPEEEGKTYFHHLSKSHR